MVSFPVSFLWSPSLTRDRFQSAVVKGLLASVVAWGAIGGLAGAEDELARYAKEGNKVGVDAKCFVNKCSLPTKACLNNPDCLKGISCLSK